MYNCFCLAVCIVIFCPCIILNVWACIIVLFGLCNCSWLAVRNFCSSVVCNCCWLAVCIVVIWPYEIIVGWPCVIFVVWPCVIVVDSRVYCFWLAVSIVVGWPCVLLLVVNVYCCWLAVCIVVG